MGLIIAAIVKINTAAIITSLVTYLKRINIPFTHSPFHRHPRYHRHTMQFPPKNSILRRPIKKSAGRANRESTDEQWEIEQEQLRKMREHRQRLAGVRSVMLFGDRHEKAQMLNKEKEQIEEHLKMKEDEQTKNREEERAIAREMQSYNHTLNCTAMAEKTARKHYNMQLLNENQRLAEYREQLKQQRKQQEIQNDKELTKVYDRTWKPNVF